MEGSFKKNQPVLNLKTNMKVGISPEGIKAEQEESATIYT